MFLIAYRGCVLSENLAMTHGQVLSSVSLPVDYFPGEPVESQRHVRHPLHREDAFQRTGQVEIVSSERSDRLVPMSQRSGR
jgi:hypothetical protein